jgi:cellulose synthase/poly-beta-1,6-N-acetylglucosamine synthase-like glycosyltransferase
VYAADVVAMTEGVQTFKALLRQRYRWKLGALQNLFKYRALIANGDGKKYSRTLTMYRLPMAVVSEFLLLVEPLLLGYIIYLSIANRTVGILLGAYITITLYTLWNVWPDEHLTTRQKLRMSFSALVIYLLFYAMSFVQLAAVYKALRNHRTIFDLTRAHGTWVSPARAGMRASFN